MTVSVDARSNAEARGEAARQLGAILSRADVEDPTLAVVGVRPPDFGEHRHVQLLNEAVMLTTERQSDLAIVRAQTAAEVHAAMALTNGMVPQLIGAPNVRRVVEPSLSDQRSQAVFEALTGVAIQRQPWWAQYRSHLGRRHAVVHTGLIVSQEDARYSIAAVREFIAFLQRQWAGEAHPP